MTITQVTCMTQCINVPHIHRDLTGVSGAGSSCVRDFTVVLILGDQKFQEAVT